MHFAYNAYQLYYNIKQNYDRNSMDKKDTKKRKTIGKISRDLTIKNEKIDHTPREQMLEQLTDYDKNIHECIESSKKKYDSDFYIVVLTKKERLMQNVIRNYFLARGSCPTPEYDQTVYKYKKNAGIVEYLWTVPAADTCTYLIANALTLPEQERDLLEFVMDFLDGTLLRHSKKLNGEAPDSPILEKG